jgi:hypothetical protein
MTRVVSHDDSGRESYTNISKSSESAEAVGRGAVVVGQDESWWFGVSGPSATLQSLFPSSQ